MAVDREPRVPRERSLIQDLALLQHPDPKKTLSRACVSRAFDLIS
jgi:hypothetical protein